MVEQQIVQRVCLNPHTPHQIRDALQTDIVCSVPNCGYLLADAAIHNWQLAYLMQYTENMDLYLAATRRAATSQYSKVLIRVLRSIDASALPQLQKIFTFQHPYIHPVLNVDWIIPNQSLAMIEPFEEHGSLAHYVQAGQPLNTQLVISLVRQIAEALYYAHEQQITHGRLKPENCLLTTPTTVQVSDFFHSTHIVDTPAVNNVYLAPEQLKGQTEPASDQYALAFIAYQLLGGRRPFATALTSSQDSMPAMIPLSSLRGDIGPSVDAVFQQAFQMQPEQRYPTIQSFAITLQREVLRSTNPNRTSGSNPFAVMNQPRGSNPGLPPNFTQMSPARNPMTPPGSNPAFPPNYPQMSPARNPMTPPGSTNPGFAPNWNYPQASPARDTFTPSGSYRHPSNANASGFSQPEATTPPPSSSMNVPQSATLLYRLGGHTSAINALRWAPNGHFIASVAEHTIRFWRIRQQTGTPLTTVLEQNGQMLALYWSPDNILLATTTDTGAIRIWNIPPEMNSIPTSKIAWWGHEGRIPALDWSHAGSSLLTGGADRTLRLWNLAGEPVAAWRAHGRGGVTTAQWSPDDQRIASGGVDHQVNVWDAQKKVTLFTCKGHNDEIRHIAWSPDGAIIASSAGKKDHRIMLWNSTTGQCVTELQEPQQEVTGMFWGPGSNWLGATTTDNLLHIWSFWPAQKAQTISLSSTPLAVDYHPTQHKVAIGMRDMSIHVLQLF